MQVRLNGRPEEVAEGATVADLLAGLDMTPEARGVAVAVDAEVIPRGEWTSYEVHADARVEILTAIQGG
jgi:sulfur carrier protein